MRRRRTSAVDGVSYQGVPLTRHRDAIIRARTGRRLPDAPPQHEAAPADATKWGVERERYAYDATGPGRTRVHTEDCPIHKGPFVPVFEPDQQESLRCHSPAADSMRFSVLKTPERS
ncbi:hypothetical protein [Streptomyces lunaelactis]|uniref:hypothetical protein n=1 Tax=Streptomyces lunaelactis TaxID=1535768 RepID=UPI001584DEF4|nr:hypothetical protein [Streptomyces lunaelactis]NUK72729.1 hypothetical protein [Streptomyces lunaelactis]NUL25350.1 hypothetical protein [Streptomyces lunaelactis]